jgi:signal transduction histidine kinase
MLDSVFRNVLKNAVEHNRTDNPEVTVGVDVGPERVTVSVADNGPGVPDDRKEQIFGRGERGMASQGTGIGLYLVQTLTEQYGGSVRVEDNEPTGAVFIVELPRAE